VTRAGTEANVSCKVENTVDRAEARSNCLGGRVLLLCSHRHDGVSAPDCCRRATECCAVLSAPPAATCIHCGSSNAQVATLINDDFIGGCQHCWKTFSLGVAILTGYIVDDDREGEGCAACERYVLRLRTIHNGPGLKC
jgi:hypothetical protein